jgi:hypothetical protein
MDSVVLRVRIGWTTPTGAILRNQAWALIGTSKSECG